MSKKLYEEMTAGTMADSSTQPKLNSSAKLLPKPLLAAVSLEYKKISNIEFDGIDYSDYPDFCDAYIVSAEYDGEQMTDEQIEELNDDSDFVYESLMNYLH